MGNVALMDDSAEILRIHGRAMGRFAMRRKENKGVCSRVKRLGGEEAGALWVRWPQAVHWRNDVAGGGVDQAG